MKKEALQIVHFGKALGEPKTRYQQVQEDRLNENFRMMLDMLTTIANIASAAASRGSSDVASGLYLGQVDPDSTATVFTAQIPGITAYYDGLAVLLKNGVVTSGAGFTIDINGIGAKPVYSNMAAATAETTIFNVNYTLLFVFDSTRVDGGCWICYRGYDSNTNTIGYQLRSNSSNLALSGALYRYRLLFTSANGRNWIPANSTNSSDANAQKTTTTAYIDPFGEIRYYSGTGTVSSGSRPSVTSLWQQYALHIGYSFNTTGAAPALTAWRPVYLKCTPHPTNGSAKISSTPYVQSLPSADDTHIYILLGIAYSNTNIELFTKHPVYCFRNGCLQQWTGPHPELPAYSSDDEDKILKIVNGIPTWVTP